MLEKLNERSMLQGTIARITYQHPETRYTVARLDAEGAASVTVVGPLFPVAEGEEIKVFGSWKNHPRYGLQFQIDHWEKVDPATVEGIEKYLGSGLIKGIGPTYAKRLVSAFGLDTLRVLSEEPLRILEVDGIGEVRARRIMQAWQEQRGMRDVMIFLQGHGVGASMALRIYRVFGSETIRRIRENPYALAREVHGIGFLLADRIANSIGISMRERRKEIAVLKVLGYRPRQILSIVLGEAMLLGALSGFLSTVLVYQAVNRLMNNNDAILPVYIPDSALWWGPAIGVATGLVGSLVPAWGACRVRVSEVFARVA